MKFAAFPIDDSVGVILAHTFRSASLILKKGHVVTVEDVALLKAAGETHVMGARLEAGDIGEDVAAAKVAARIAGAKVRVTEARTGRCNIEATHAGVVNLGGSFITAANLISETVTIATVADKQAVRAGQIIATVKIIPFAVSGDVMNDVLATFTEPVIHLIPFRPKRFALISTLSSGLKPSVVASTEDVTRDRIGSLEGSLVAALQTRHVAADVADSLRAAVKTTPDIILIAGASATVDRNDIIPAAIRAVGGVIDHFGMPVDPGNLLVLAHIDKTPVLVLPGCARSPKLNGTDWVLQRLAADMLITAQDIMRMGVGGLLVDIPSRPVPRAIAVGKSSTRRIAAVVLAAGQSRRMEGANKLLMPVKGELLVRRTVRAVQAAHVEQVIVVTGHQNDEVEEALADLDVTIVHNPRYAAGLSTSLKAGLGALKPEIDAVLICLGDMPAVGASHLNRLIGDFDPENDRAIGVPTHSGKRGNPVLWGRRFFGQMQEVAGDVGARHLIGANESLVYEVEFGDTGVLTDLDTPEQWQDYLSKPRA